ncbi:hypothetical protein BT69DRAFT_1216793 [Atractiella rhizophila]|nr:hypothetical protein BT69DRAFT_1216793 [Atractiella rhizophila]
MSSLSSFQLEVLQHPSRSRMTGFGSTDRRSLDPPPVVRLKARDENGILVRDSAFESETMLCHAELWQAEDGQEREQRNHVWSEREVVRNLLGTLTVPGRRLKDQFGNASVLFVFNDLAVRTEGTFTLRFTVLDLNSKMDSPVSPPLAREFSHPFRVYSPKSFPGMQTSTQLTKALAKQGVKLILRKSTRSENSGEEGEGDGEVDGEEEDDPEPGPRPTSSSNNTNHTNGVGTSAHAHTSRGGHWEEEGSSASD